MKDNLEREPGNNYFVEAVLTDFTAKKMGADLKDVFTQYYIDSEHSDKVRSKASSILENSDELRKIHRDNSSQKEGGYEYYNETYMKRTSPTY
jgi:hypothetical protein